VWDIGTIQLGNAPIHGTYLVGYPKPLSASGESGSGTK